MYKYETHLHSSNCSACGKSSAREMVQAYKNAGYSGFVLTDHFVTGNSCVPYDLDWKSRMKMFYDAYLEAKDEGEKLDFDVLFGLEHYYNHGKEILVYGIDLEFLQAHPELEKADIETFAKLVHEQGGILVHAHPHRKRDYIDDTIEIRYDVCDGIEVYNACNNEDDGDDLAMQDATHLGKIMTSGGDIHRCYDERIGLAGMVFEKRIKSNGNLIEALQNREGHLLINGKMEK